MVDSGGDVWFGTEGGGLNKYSYQQDRFFRLPYGNSDQHHLPNNIVWSLLEDSSGYIWVGTNGGLSKYDKGLGKFEHFQASENDPQSLSNNAVLSIFEDSSGRLWVGTRSGLNRMMDGGQGFGTIGTRDGLANDSINSIVEDHSGDLWMGTNDGLARVDPELLSMRNYNQTNWARGKFNYGSAMKLSSGELVFGGVNGFVRFFPEEVNGNAYVPPIAFTDFQIFNQSQKPGAEESVINSHIDVTKSISLKHNQSVFSFHFSALNFYSSENNQFAYKLEGFDKKWNYVKNLRRATYTNIGAGEYRFVVKASNNNEVWNEEGRSIRLRIEPPPWQSVWAYIAYILAASLLFWWYFSGQQKKLQQEKSISGKLRQLDRMKDDFLANTSHELKTPINGIIGLADAMKDGDMGDLPEPVRYNLKIISNSGRRLDNLVNDILDLSLLKRDKIQLKLVPVSLRSIVDIVVVMSLPLVEKKDLDISNAVDGEIPLVLADENRLQQILYNLIGNAIKYCQSGLISITADWEDQFIWVKVRDTGIGIASEQLETIFESFEQVESHVAREFGGAGLGLAVTKQLVELHSGEIRVESVPDEGSTFSFSLPYSETQFLSKEEETASMNRLFFTSDYDWVPEAERVRKREQDKATAEDGIQRNLRFRILVVDDESVNRQILVNQLGLQNYQVVDVSSGRDALEAVEEQGPFDLILLDIMMPRMSGYEVCSRVRKIYSMYELPIIFLSAKSMISDLVDGFEVGANDFLTKPISRGELIARVDTHLRLLDIHRNLEAKIKEKTEGMEKTNQVLETLDGIVATINQEIIPERLLDVLLRESSQLVDGIERSTYWSFDNEEQAFSPEASYGYTIINPAKITVGKDRFIDRYCGNGQKLAEDLFLTENLNPDADPIYLIQELPRSRFVLAIVIRFDNDILGLLCLESFKQAVDLSDYEIQAVQKFQHHSRLALFKTQLMEALKKDKKKLEDSRLTDELTGLKNRSFLTHYLESDIALTLRAHNRKHSPAEVPENSDLLFFILDIDHFKQLNKSCGNEGGDDILQQMKPLIERVFRESDFMIYLDSGKFLVVARFSNRNAAPDLAERLRASIANKEFEVGDVDGSGPMSTRVECSIGFSVFPFFSNSPLAFSWEQVIEIAELCLATAKRSQRNCWVGLESLMPDPSTEVSPSLSFMDVSTRTKQLIEKGKLELHHSLPADTRIRW